ncbi:MAG TPA: FG-GAP-like repeat-containing protein [Pyrinomonadaceae bacterium]|nr:FG-GAP-like repeat-containing protein [Pyrinomonadaceae bacterium]
MKPSRPPLARTLLPATVLCLLLPLVPASSAAHAPRQDATQARQMTTSVLLRWNRTRGVERYRLQVALDARFRDIVYDTAVLGLEHRVIGLAPGTYYWRVAPAEGETGRFTRGTPVVVTSDTPRPASSPAASSGTTRTTAPNVFDASLNPGWRTATGDVARLVSADLRADRGGDLLSVNKDGMVHALNGTTGVALWTARYRPEAKRGEPTGSLAPVNFSPLVARTGGGALVVVAFDGGVRALLGETGREVWRAQLPAGIAAGGAVADMDGDGKPEVVVVAGSPSTLYVLDAETGRAVAERKLEGVVVDSPVAFAPRGVALALQNGVVAILEGRAEVTRTVNLEGAATTAPLVVQASVGQIMTVGTEKGLDALEAKELKLLGRISTENDTVRGRQAAVDLEGDGTTEIAIVTQRGRVAVVGTGDGKIKWFAEGASDAWAASFADLNGDGTLDVLVPAGPTFALGFSGRDGAPIWKAEETGRPVPTVVPAGAMRTITVVPTSGDGAYAVGGEPSRVGVRAVELPKSSRRAVSRN